MCYFLLNFFVRIQWWKLGPISLIKWWVNNKFLPLGKTFTFFERGKASKYDPWIPFEIGLNYLHFVPDISMWTNFHQFWLQSVQNCIPNVISNRTFRSDYIQIIRKNSHTKNLTLFSLFSPKKNYIFAIFYQQMIFFLHVIVSKSEYVRHHITTCILHVKYRVVSMALSSGQETKFCKLIIFTAF